VPAFDLSRHPAAADRALLAGLPKAKAEITWVPWTYRRLGLRSGYGAGVPSPGWYAHLFAAPDRPVARWMATVAGLLRAEDQPVSPAHVIEAVRLAETLAALRGRPLAGLEESRDAVRAVLCEGSDVPLALVDDRLVVGDALGAVPEAAPAVPLQRDLTRAQRALRLRPEAEERELDLDLREPTGAARSRLLHRLRLLGVPWGEPLPARGGSLGTFRESWRLRWEPELHVRVAEAGVWGTTVELAATARAREAATRTASLADTTDLAERCLLAHLPEALPVVLRVLADRAALDSDVVHLAQALPALARTLRYGDVRGTDAGAVRGLAESLAVRICVGLPPACTGLDEDAAAEMRDHLDATHTALALLDDRGEESPSLAAGRCPQRGRWAGTLRAVARRAGVPGLLRGRAARLLLDGGDAELDAAREMALALAPAAEPLDAAGWLEGFLGGSGLLLVHDAALLALVDGWLTAATEEVFTDVLPVLRRTFAAFEAGVRRAIGERVRDGLRAPAEPAHEEALDPARAAAVLPTLALLLGTPLGGAGGETPASAGGGRLAREAVQPPPASDAGPAPAAGAPGAPATPHRAEAGRSPQPLGHGVGRAPASAPGVADGSAAAISQQEAGQPSRGRGALASGGVAGRDESASLRSPAGETARALARWRLVLGGEADGTGHRPSGRDAAVDGALAALYGGETGGRRGGLGASAPQLARWLGDIRTYFPPGVIRLLQRDAIDRLGLDRLLLEPETLAAVEPDVHLVGTLLSLAHALPETTRESARAVVRRVADDLERRLAARTRALVGGALDRSARTRRPRPQDIDWQRTIRANLAHYLPEQRTVVPRRLVGGARTRNGCATQVILCVDQSASMASSVVHSAVFAAVLASVRGLTTRLVAFDTSVVDLTGRLADPVDVLFGVRLGGGTDIGRALAYCQSRVSRPDETVLVLISDLAEGGSREELLRRVAALTASGVRVLALLALSDEGAPAYDHENAAAFAALGVDAFACTPDHFPEVMAAALERRPLPLPSAGQE
jgi:Mg-chelatase subunit ChlD